MTAPDPHQDPSAQPEPSATQTPGAEAQDPSAELTELKARHAEVSDAYLRAKAETENIRRRSEDEISKARKFAIEGFADSLLPVKDSLEAAIALPGATPEQLLEVGG